MNKVFFESNIQRSRLVTRNYLLVTRDYLRILLSFI